MPSFYIHERTVFMARGAAQEPVALALGAYGPDVLYFGSRNMRRLGRVLHSERTCQFLCALLRACADDETAREYARGFLSHYAADTLFHPFVYSLSMTPQGYSGIRHIEIEHALDAWLNSLIGTRHKPMPSRGLIAQVSLRLCAALGALYPQCSADSGDVRRAITNSLSVGGVMGRLGELPGSMSISSEGGTKVISPDQLQTLAQLGWRDPWSEELCHAGPFALLGEAILRTEELIRAADSFWQGALAQRELEEVIGDLSYLSGKRWQDTRKLSPHEVGRLRALYGRLVRSRD